MTISLNSEQLIGVQAVDGNHVMIAGPGSGKTRVLVERYLRMRAAGIPDSDILNLTFTNAAATEMAERVGLFNAEEVFRTFHSYCLALLKQERGHLPFPTNPAILPVRGEQYALIKDLLHVYKSIHSYGALHEFITTCKAKNISVEEALDDAPDKGLEYFYALAYRDYERKMREQGWLDFDAIMKETVALLEGNNEVRLRNQRKYIAVDECQDTDTTQFRLLELLYAGNIFAVGDENQLIYEWRSAQSGSLTNFGKVFKGSKTLFLGTNYRSTQKLVEFLKAILPVDNGLASHMKSARHPGEDVRFISYADEDEEANEVLNDISDRGISEESAILARTNRQLQLLQRRAMSRNIRTEVLGKKNVWQENEVKHLLELTKERFADTRPAATVMNEIIRQEGLTARYANTRTKALDKDPIENLNDIVRMAGRKNRATGMPLTIPEFLDWLRRMTHMRRSKRDPILTLSTVHQAKGREWKYVYVIGAEQGRMPHRDGELQEEHRIFFVACSRAADELQISWVGNRSQFLNDFEEQVEYFGEEDEQD